MKILNQFIPLALAAALSVSMTVPAFASHKFIDSDRYVLEENEDEELTCTYLDGKPVTGWVQDEDENIYYFERGTMNHGWDKIRGEWYYFDPETGVLATSCTVLNYEVDEDGKMIKIHEW